METLTRRVLLVEDNEDDYLIVRDLLSDITATGFDLRWVNNYQDAREALTRHQYDVCLLDYGLGEATGIDLVCEFGAGETPFVLLTGHENHEVDVAAATAGAADYLIKGEIKAPLLERSIRYAIERKKTEVALHHAQRFAQATVDALPGNIAVLDGQGTIISVNSAWHESVASNGFIGAGYSIGTNYLEMCEQSNDANWHAAAAKIRAVIAGEEQVPVLEYPCHSASTPQWFEMSTTRFPTGGPLYIVVAHENITERKRAEERLRQSEANLAKAQQIARLGSWELELLQAEDFYANPLYWSDEVFRIFGYEPGQIEVSNENFFRAVHPDDLEQINATVIQACRDGQNKSFEHRILLPDGSERVVQERFEIVFNKDTGKPSRMVGTVQDITERKRIEDALRESEAQFRTLTETMPQIVWVTRPDGWHTHYNQKWMDYTGLSLEESLGHGWNPPFHPEDRPRAARRWQEATQSGEPYEIEYRLRRADGNYRWMLGRALPMRDATGAIVRWFGTCTDIHDLKVAEEELSQANREQQELTAQLEKERARLIEAQAVAKIGSWELDIATGALIWSDENYRIFGIDRDKFGGFYEAFLQLIHPEDRTTVDKAYKESVVHRTPYAIDHRIQLEDGSFKVVHERCQTFYNDQGCPTRSVGTSQDITERKQAEEERDRFFMLSVDMLGIAGLDGYFKRLNPAFSETLGYSEAELLAMPFLELVHPEDQVSTQMAVETLSQGRPVVGFENRYRHNDGSWRWIEWRSAAVPEKGLIYAVARDVTQRKQAEAALHKANDELELHVMERTAELEAANEALRIENIERQVTLAALQESTEALQRAKEEADQANAAKSEFLSRMSHELRTPLNAILGFGQVLEMGRRLNDRDAAAVKNILNGGRHLLDLINEVLDIARVESGHLELSLQPIPLGDIGADACALVRPLAVERRIRLDINTFGLEHKSILADRQRLKQVLINLLSNAIKYNRERGQVTVSYQQTRDGWISITVQDTGPGISDQDLPKLFTPFERLGAAGSAVEGTGLGLVLSQRMVQAMDGTLSVTSTLGQGTTFTIELPQATIPGEQATEWPETTHELDAGPDTGPSCSVLCIEDNPANLQLMEAIFENRPQITLLVAVQGSVGLDLARQHKPDLIILDMNLPDINGKEVLARLQQSAPTREIPVVVVSADATLHQMEQVLAAGAVAYLSKPLDIDQFLDTVDNLLLPPVATA
jgi:PAS domain S-box-containing protein